MATLCFQIDISGQRRLRGALPLGVGALADAEPLLALPERPYPAEVLEVRTVAANALVSFGPTGPRRRPRADPLAPRRRHLAIIAAGVVVCTHQLAPRGAQRTVGLPEHTTALATVVLGAFSTDRPCKRKLNRPPSDAALAIAAELLGDQGADPVIDLDVYRQAIEGDQQGTA